MHACVCFHCSLLINQQYIFYVYTSFLYISFIWYIFVCKPHSMIFEPTILFVSLLPHDILSWICLTLWFLSFSSHLLFRLLSLTRFFLCQLFFFLLSTYFRFPNNLFQPISLDVVQSIINTFTYVYLHQTRHHTSVNRFLKPWYMHEILFIYLYYAKRQYRKPRRKRQWEENGKEFAFYFVNMMIKCSFSSM